PFLRVPLASPVSAHQHWTKPRCDIVIAERADPHRIRDAITATDAALAKPEAPKKNCKPEPLQGKKANLPADRLSKVSLQALKSLYSVIWVALAACPPVSAIRRSNPFLAVGRADTTRPCTS